MVKGIDDEQWLREMMSLARQEVRKPRPDHYQLTHDERLIRDFMDGTGIFAEDQP
jgi:hypothetical protein